MTSVRNASVVLFKEYVAFVVRFILSALVHSRTHVEWLQRVVLVRRINVQPIVCGFLTKLEPAVIAKVVPHLRLRHDSVSHGRVRINDWPVIPRSRIGPSVNRIIQCVDQRVPPALGKSLLHLFFISLASLSHKHLRVHVVLTRDLILILRVVWFVVCLKMFLVGVLSYLENFGSLDSQEGLIVALRIHHIDVLANLRLRIH